MSGSSPRVLVTGARLPAALEIARALTAAGAEVWAADSVAITPTRASNAVRGYFRFPSPALRPAAFREVMLGQVRKLGITQIVPVSEEIFHLARLRGDLDPRTTLFAPAIAELRALHSKWTVLERAADCGVKIPWTRRAETPAQLRELLAAHPDCVAKAEFSRGAYLTRFPPHEGGQEPPPSSFPWLVQERLTGREISTLAVAHEGRVLAQATYLPKYRVGAGASLYFDPLKSAAAENFVQRFVTRHAVTGHIAFDFMETGGELTLLECNPRATSGVHLFPADQPWASAYWGMPFTQSDGSTPGCSKTGVLAAHGLRALRHGEFGKVRADLRRARDTCFRRGDPWPALALPFSGLEIAWRSLAWPVKTRHAYTYDLEWNGE